MYDNCVSFLSFFFSFHFSVLINCRHNNNYNHKVSNESQSLFGHCVEDCTEWKQPKINIFRAFKIDTPPQSRMQASRSMV